MTMQFIECDTCRAKPGSPYLCAGCLNNRRVIEFLTGKTTQARAGHRVSTRTKWRVRDRTGRVIREGDSGDITIVDGMIDIPLPAVPGMRLGDSLEVDTP